jgi:hypothetical protein
VSDLRGRVRLGGSLREKPDERSAAIRRHYPSSSERDAKRQDILYRHVHLRELIISGRCCLRRDSSGAYQTDLGFRVECQKRAWRPVG